MDGDDAVNPDPTLGSGALRRAQMRFNREHNLRAWRPGQDDLQKFVDFLTPFAGCEGTYPIASVLRERELTRQPNRCPHSQPHDSTRKLAAIDFDGPHRGSARWLFGPQHRGSRSPAPVTSAIRAPPVRLRKRAQPIAHRAGMPVLGGGLDYRADPPRRRQISHAIDRKSSPPELRSPA